MRKCLWEGNLRELKNCVDYMAFMSGDLIEKDALPEEYFIIKPDITAEIEYAEGFLMQTRSLSVSSLRLCIIGLWVGNEFCVLLQKRKYN